MSAAPGTSTREKFAMPVAFSYASNSATACGQREGSISACEAATYPGASRFAYASGWSGPPISASAIRSAPA
ncbi:hypothetical protein D9M72_639270 [compost metagenome]